jgi:hypothetical protein
VSIQRSRNGSVRARREHQKAIDWVSRRLCPTPHSRKLYGEKKKSEKKKREREGFVRRRPTLPFDARAGEATFATRVLLRDVDAENIFVARVACARFLANSGEKKRERNKRVPDDFG